MASATEVKVEGLQDLVPLLHRTERFDAVVELLAGGRSASIDGAWGSACALCAAALAARCDQLLLVVLPRVSDIDGFAADLAGFRGSAPSLFPAWESLPQEHRVSDAVFGGRLRILGQLTDRKVQGVIVTSIQALLQPVPNRETRARMTRRVSVGQELDPEELLRWLVECGFQRVPAVEMAGEFSVHGGIVDLFPPDAPAPLRIEFFGDQVESIRYFDIETQRKIEELTQTTLLLISPDGTAADNLADSVSNVAPGAPVARGRPPESVLDSLPAGSWIALVELNELVEEGNHYLQRLGTTAGLFDVQTALARCAEFPTVTVASIGQGEATCDLHVESIERFTGARNEALAELARAVARDDGVLIACHNEGERQRLAELLAESDPTLGAKARLCLGSVSRGFHLVAQRLAVIGDHELFGRTEIRRTRALKQRPESRAIESFLELNVGDLVVHLMHGIGRYRGMKLLRHEEQAEEHLILEFRDGVRMYVPVSLIHLVQKYVGASKGSPTLSKLGGSGWEKKKARAARAVVDLASDMLRLQAARESLPGIASPPDGKWQDEFEASFPYTETDDQLRAAEDVRIDMQKSRPMDRLLCGDVGYGKTEVAMRAAFRAIEAGRQVAVLVPTTILAEQHYRTFCERMAEYPVAIEVLSRFKTKGQQRAIIEGLATGGVDVVIGTHRLVQKDVAFKKLGLVIIDEEQRFGVEAKETLKRLRLEVDVLTMSATPIPRTLHMSLLGIRDISNLTTAPQDRQAISTRICRFDKELVRSAVIREMNRNGQIYFVHNRVYNIQAIADIVQAIVPEARLGIAHGQMHEHELESAMFDFVSGKTDILVCTTIIESGLDIPNVNTIFIHQANRFGLAELHQLRGRVGRYKHRAFCYLMLEEGATLTATASRRLKAIEEFSELGAGFKIAMRDLEIRGAGNILGMEQSGHISAVGYELYCRLLEDTVRRLKRLPPKEQKHVAVNLPVKAFIPEEYVSSSRQKVEMYRKLSNCASVEELTEIQNEFRDRFGVLPEEVARLFELKLLQLAAQAWQIDEIYLEEGFAVFAYRNPDAIRELAHTRGSRFRIADGSHAYWLLGRKKDHDEGTLLQEIRAVLDEPVDLNRQPVQQSTR